jgi:hypothetical protein
MNVKWSAISTNLFALIVLLAIGTWYYFVVDGSGIEGVLLLIVLAIYVVVANDPIRTALKYFGTALGIMILGVAFCTTILKITATSTMLLVIFVVSLVLSTFSLDLREVVTRRTIPMRSLIPAIHAGLVFALLGSRVISLEDPDSRWWVITQGAEDNAAWLNMSTRAARNSNIAIDSVENLGHTLPIRNRGCATWSPNLHIRRCKGLERNVPKLNPHLSNK